MSFFDTELGRRFQPALSLYQPQAGMVRVPKSAALWNAYAGAYHIPRNRAVTELKQ